MNRIFGSKTTAPKPSLMDAVNSIDNRVATLDVKLAKLNAELSTYQQKMSRMRDGPGKNALKQKALKILKQRRQVESQKDQLQSQSWNMEQAAMTSENLRNTMATVDAMKTANKELKRQYGKINIDKIESLQDEMADLLEVSEELQSTMSRNYAVPDDIDEAELDAELEALGEEMEFEQLNEPTAEGTPSYLTEDSSLPTFVDEPVEHDKQEVAAS
ncbi:Vps60p [Sugiyamaella lignohabitans]|uniref:Vps60p n=1 Tax=Sugiyamaella lignohabitans TaxID=796027 RepID=A0A167END6_9ASCO|nr:Vps60p [Sugiyamaella lignohabitans]ANB14276.1 Vps60p [Sugiyamaella lignohabitans]